VKRLSLAHWSASKPDATSSQTNAEP